MSIMGLIGYAGLIFGGLIGLLAWQRMCSINLGRIISGMIVYIMLDCFLMLQWSASGILYLFLLFVVIMTFQDRVYFSSEWFGWLVTAGLAANLLLFQGNIFGTVFLDSTRVILFYEFIVIIVLISIIFVLGIPSLLVFLKGRARRPQQSFLWKFLKLRVVKIGIVIGLLIINFLLFSLVRVIGNFLTETVYQELINGLTLLFPIYSIGVWFHIQRNFPSPGEKAMFSTANVAQTTPHPSSSEEVTTRIIRSIASQEEPKIGVSQTPQSYESKLDSFEEYLQQQQTPSSPPSISSQHSLADKLSALSKPSHPIEIPPIPHYELPPNCPSCKRPLDARGFCNNCQKKVCPRCYNLNPSDTVTCACGYIFEEPKENTLKLSETANQHAINHPILEAQRVQNDLLGVEGLEPESLSMDSTLTDSVLSLRICPYCGAVGWKEDVCRCGYNYLTKEYLPKKKE